MKKCKLRDLASIVAGQSPKSEFYTFDKSDTPFLQGNRTFGSKYPYIDTYTKKVTKLVQSGSILMSVRAPVGDLNIINEDCCIGRGLCSINALNGDNEFIYYLLKHNIKSIINQGNGTTYDAINKEQLGDLEIRLPSEDEMNLRKISNLLSTIDNKIENNNKINSDLESMAKTIYDYWFLQFEFPNEEGKPYKSSGGKMVWNEELKREIPEGWEVKRLSDVSDILMGQSPKSESYNDRGEGIPLINGAAELQKDIVRISKYTTIPTRICKVNDLIFCIRATIGNLRFSDKEYCLGRGVAAITPKDYMYIEYMFFYLNNILDLYNKVLSGSIIIGITKEDLQNKPIIVPTVTILKGFSNRIKDTITYMKRIEKENQQLSSLRDFLLPLLMNGQVGFKDEISEKEIDKEIKLNV